MIRGHHFLDIYSLRNQINHKPIWRQKILTEIHFVTVLGMILLQSIYYPGINVVVFYFKFWNQWSLYLTYYFLKLRIKAQEMKHDCELLNLRTYKIWFFMWIVIVSVSLYSCRRMIIYTKQCSFIIEKYIFNEC